MNKKDNRSFSERTSDRISDVVGSWGFIIVQSTILCAWIGFNLIYISYVWDPYPFILLNLVLSFQAAFTAPIIMMSQNRQSEIDRKKAHHDYQINVKAESEIKQLHDKLDLLKDNEIKLLIGLLRRDQKV